MIFFSLKREFFGRFAVISTLSRNFNGRIIGILKTDLGSLMNIIGVFCLFFSGILGKELIISKKVFFDLVGRNNLGLQEKKLDLDISRSEVLSASELFDINVSLEAGYTKANTPSSSSLDGAGGASSVIAKTQSYGLTMSKSFYSGTTIRVPYGLDIINSNSTFRSIEKTFEPSLTFSLEQDLRDLFYWGRFSKKYDKAIVKDRTGQLKSEIDQSKLIVKLIEKYLDGLDALFQLDLKKQAYINGEKKFQLMVKKFSLGKASLIQKNDAQINLFKAQEKLENQKIKFQKITADISQELFQKTEYPWKYDKEFGFVSDWKKIDKGLGDLKELIDNSPEVKKRMEEVNLAKREFSWAKGDSFPSMDLSASYKLAGVRETYSLAQKEVWEGQFPTTNYGLTMERAVHNYAAKSSRLMKEALWKQKKLLLQKTRFEQEIDLKEGVAKIKKQMQIVMNYKKMVGLLKEKLGFYEKKLQQGSLSVYDYNTQYEEVLKTDIDYKKSQISLERFIIRFLQKSGQLKRLTSL